MPKRRTFAKDMENLRKLIKEMEEYEKTSERYRHLPPSPPFGTSGGREGPRQKTWWERDKERHGG